MDIKNITTAIMGDKYINNSIVSSSGIDIPILDTIITIAIGTNKTSIIRIRPFSTPNLINKGNMTDIIVIPADKDAKLINIFSVILILEKIMLIGVDKARAAIKKITPSKYLLTTIFPLDIGMVRAYLSHLFLSS